jgi:hypothetical protein
VLNTVPACFLASDNIRRATSPSTRTTANGVDQPEIRAAFSPVPVVPSNQSPDPEGIRSLLLAPFHERTDEPGSCQDRRRRTAEVLAPSGIGLLLWYLHADRIPVIGSAAARASVAQEALAGLRHPGADAAVRLLTVGIGVTLLIGLNQRRDAVRADAVRKILEAFHREFPLTTSHATLIARVQQQARTLTDDQTEHDAESLVLRHARRAMAVAAVQSVVGINDRTDCQVQFAHENHQSDECTVANAALGRWYPAAERGVWWSYEREWSEARP